MNIVDDNDVAIGWIDLSYSVKPFWFSKKKLILNQLCGCIEFCTITALMGPSGAGKTTLLNCINGKISAGLERNTRIYVNNEQNIKSCFIGQHEKDHLIMGLTAKQNLIYASKLKNSSNKKKNSNGNWISHQNNVNNILSELMISDISDTKVERCSGGEQKRLTIAIEMTKIVKPKLLCIDEPTTGLDSNAAEIVISCLQKLAKTHRMAIITSIHQPSNDIMQMFDNIYVLAKGGNCVFDGHVLQIRTHLNQCSIICSEDEVPIEQLLKLASIETQDNEYINELISKTREIQRKSVIIKCKDKTKLSPNGIEFRSKSFKLIDVWYIMMRSITYTLTTRLKPLFYALVYYILYIIMTSKMFNENIGKADACFNPNKISNNTCQRELEDDELLFQNSNYLFLTTLPALCGYLLFVIQLYINDVKIFINEHQNS